jgi:hypothetical protein
MFGNVVFLARPAKAFWQQGKFSGQWICLVASQNKQEELLGSQKCQRFPTMSPCCWLRLGFAMPSLKSCIF